MKSAHLNNSDCAVIDSPEIITKDVKSDTQLPSAEEFLALIEDEEKETAENPSLYSVYHKYSKGC
jgi:hypothetical protein